MSTTKRNEYQRIPNGQYGLVQTASDGRVHHVEPRLVAIYSPRYTMRDTFTRGEAARRTRLSIAAMAGLYRVTAR